MGVRSSDFSAATCPLVGTMTQRRARHLSQFFAPPFRGFDPKRDSPCRGPNPQQRATTARHVVMGICDKFAWYCAARVAATDSGRGANEREVFDAVGRAGSADETCQIRSAGIARLPRSEERENLMARKHAKKGDSNSERDNASAEQTALAMPAGMASGSLLGRTAAARAIGVSKTTFRRRYQGSLLPAEVGSDGVHRFREEQNRELVIQRGAKSTPPDAHDGALAPNRFCLPDPGVHPLDIVKRFGPHPRAL